MESAQRKLPLKHRLNLRVLAFAMIGLALLGWPVYAFVTYQSVEKHGDVYEVDLKAMSDFGFDQNGGKLADIPETWRNLDGKRVALEGEMASLSSAGPQAGDIQLCYSRQRCCFSGQPQVQHFVNMHRTDGQGLDYIDNQVRVVGTLHVNVIRGEAKVLRIYALDVESVEAKN